VAMSTCAGCGVALDSSGGHASRECPNCKRGESVEGRHFYCSKECFTSSWAVHKKRHVRKARTITLDMDVNYTRDEVASFGFMSDVEWDDFQATPDFTAAMAQQLKQAQMMSKEAEKCMMSKDAEKYNDIPRSSWNTSLNVICSMQKVTLEQVYSAVQDVLLMTTFLYDKESTDQHQMQPINIMFEILRRNYLYHVSLLVFEASNRIQGVAGRKVQEEFYQQVTGHPAMLFAKCFGEAFSINSLAAQEELTKVKSVTKMRDESFDLTCPMYVCAFVATMLLKMWNDRLSSIRGNGEEGGGGSSPLSSAVPTAASATSAFIVQRIITAEERAKLSVGLLKLLGRKLPSFWNMKMRRRGQLSFRDFLKGVNGHGSREAKRLGRLEDACRRGSPEPKQRMGPGGGGNRVEVLSCMRAPWLAVTEI